MSNVLSRTEFGASDLYPGWYFHKKCDIVFGI